MCERVRCGREPVTNGLRLTGQVGGSPRRIVPRAQEGSGSALLTKNMSGHIAPEEIMLKAAKVIMEARKLAIFPL